jgi:hypothetical protein
MSSICNFFIVVEGAEGRVRELKEFIKTAIDFNKYGSGNHLLNVFRLCPDAAEDEERFLDLSRPWRPKPGARMEDDCFCFAPDDSGFSFHGESTYGPPFFFVERLSKQFSDLEFKFGGTTDNEFYEEYTCKDGATRLLHASQPRIDYDGDEIRFIYCEDGVELDPPHVVGDYLGDYVDEEARVAAACEGFPTENL